MTGTVAESVANSMLRRKEAKYLNMNRFVLLIAVLVCCQVSFAGTSSSSVSAQDLQFREWIDEMRKAPRGPFSRIRWFCKDGTILPPKAYACEPHGGGVQHGEWNEKTLTLRENGYYIANVLAGLDASELPASRPTKTNTIKFLSSNF